MTKPPPEDLMDWPKAQLAKEVARLRAINREFAEPIADPPTSGGDIVDVAGDPHARGGAVIDARNAVLMDGIDVAVVDTRSGEDSVVMMLVLEGRVNYSTRRVKQAYMFDANAAASIVTQLLGIAARAGGLFRVRFQAAVEEQMEKLP